MNDCIFCKLANTPNAIIAENQHAFAIRDINPSAPIHLLVIPKEHIRSLNQIDAKSETMNAIIKLAQDLSNDYQIAGYKLNCNVESAGGQEVMHLHFHFLAKSSDKSIA
ncbi:histidine triad nucleotide-binding protein [Candidatus Peregrinibacteria bacterium CG11_big_fil_rev_8_21_14_0_20_41_10]|nr:MAG: histidine triad nucleotide-binding protein [Candidatus Peregrinibacteria bacterium CG11_big_fil_rev_8_21_14_0_20_41_10]PIZ76195.1 MAG: histidine triad nucleotide-binding protein [Candidatus Peregrinibacteria bacterium CG_4_10_14_0_2_um_filter_41_8]PJC37696.1 MAG: histidine triad nucleotide-binding protein [Candidatus Peregrinibacteria bacterium CG_4_9_14_0_2_um_filter_41_14]